MSIVIELLNLTSCHQTAFRADSVEHYLPDKTKDIQTGFGNGWYSK